MKPTEKKSMIKFSKDRKSYQKIFLNSLLLYGKTRFVFRINRIS